MRSFKINFVFCVAVLFFAECKTENISPNSGSVNIINAAINAGSIKVNYLGKRINWSFLTGADGVVNYSASKVFTIFGSNDNYPFTIVPTLDTLKTIFAEKIPVTNDPLYSLYVIGQVPSYEGLLKKESDIPYNFADSAVAIRFINLSPNSAGVKVVRTSTPNVNEVDILNYKQQSDFKKYPIKKSIPPGSITFEIRSVDNNALLTTYTLPVTAIAPYTNVNIALSRFKSLTIAIKGISGTSTGTNAFGTLPIPNY